MKRQRWILLVAVLAIPIAALFFTGARPAARAGEPAAAPERAVAAPGIVEPATEEREISAEVTGTLVEVLVEENDRVTAGQPLAIVRDDDLRAKNAGAEALVELRESDLRRLLNGARAEERKVAAADVDDAEALVRLSEREHARNEKLFAKGTIAEASLDQSRHAQESAAARLRAAKERHALVKAPARADEVAQAKALLAAAEASTREVRAQLDKTVIRAPIDGTVLRRFKDAGEVVTQQPVTLVFTVGDLTRLRVRAEIDEADIGVLAMGQRAYATADAYRDTRFGGRVIRIANRLGSKSIQTERPSEKADTKVLEALVELDADTTLPIGLRVDVFFATP